MSSRRGLEAWVRRWWSGRAGWAGRMASIAFLPAEGLFRWSVAARNRLYDLEVLEVGHAEIPVLSIGNLTVGGTGKTPLVGWFVRRLVEAGASPSVVARGYGRDEMMLHRRWYPGLPVIGEVDRLAGVRRATESGADVAVLDDGFQHRRLHRDIDVVVVAAETAFPGRRLPRGPYREGPGALRRADLAVVTRKTASVAEAQVIAHRIRARHPGLAVARARFRPGGWTRLDGTAADAPSGAAVVLTAVAEPEQVRALALTALASVDSTAPTTLGAADPNAPTTLGAADPNAPAALGAADPNALILDAFPDHHDFTEAEIRRAASRSRALVVTEKDAVKLAEHATALGGVSVHVLTLEVVWEEGEAEAHAVVERLTGART